MAHKALELSPFREPGAKQIDLLVIAGEHSGDEHAARLVKDLKTARPDLEIAAIGGEAVAAAGAYLVYDLTKVSVVGVFEVLKHFSFFKKLFHEVLSWIERHQPRQICFVDYPGFNLRLAHALKKRGISKKGGGRIELNYYIGPQVWAWKAKRRFKMAETLDRLGVIFPFEVESFADTRLPVEFVGHPFVSKTYQLPLKFDPDGPILLLPGSRTAAVDRIFPVLLEAFQDALQGEPDLFASVVYPSEQILELLRAHLVKYPNLADKISFVSNQEVEIPGSRVLMSSGTISLVCALAAIPGAIVYRLHPLSYLLGRLLVKIPYIGIANILLKREVYAEFIQGEADPVRLAEALGEAGKAERLVQIQEDAAALRALLKVDGQTQTVAAWMLRTLDSPGKV